MPDPRIMEQVARLRALAPKVEDKPRVYPAKQLPLWPNVMRAAPSVVLRSALFRVSKNKLGSFKGAKVASWKGAYIEYTGLELTQQDLDVWLQALHMAREQLGTKVTFTALGMLKSIGRRGTGKNDFLWLKNTLTKLTACAVVVTSTDGRKTYGAGLVNEFKIDGNACYLTINPSMVELFDDGYTWVEWKTRLGLKGNLTKWLHAYICSHQATTRAPSKIKLENLQELYGSESGLLRQFRDSIRRSITQLEEKNVMSSWSIEKDVLAFARPERPWRKPGQAAFVHRVFQQPGHP